MRFSLTHQNSLCCALWAFQAFGETFGVLIKVMEMFFQKSSSAFPNGQRMQSTGLKSDINTQVFLPKHIRQSEVGFWVTLRSALTVHFTKHKSLFCGGFRGGMKRKDVFGVVCVCVEIRESVKPAELWLTRLTARLRICNSMKYDWQGSRTTEDKNTTHTWMKAELWSIAPHVLRLSCTEMWVTAERCSKTSRIRYTQPRRYVPK